MFFEKDVVISGNRLTIKDIPILKEDDTLLQTCNEEQLLDKIISLADGFIVIHDPRIDRTKKHKLVDILIITLCATICGVEGWEKIEIFAEEREDWCKGFLELPNGIPSHDTIYRVFSRINPKERTRPH